MNYLESGYNGQPWSKKSSREDIFYFDMTFCESSDIFENEIEFAINKIRQDSPNWKFLNDNSLVSQVITQRLHLHETLNPSSADYFDLNFWTMLNSKYEIIHKKDLAYLTLVKNLGCTLVYPMTSGRIINANFSRHLKKSMDTPYWVFIEPERIHKMRLCARDLKLSIFPDFCKLTPQVARSYFMHPLHLFLYEQKNYSEPHNDLIERQIWKSISLFPIANLYPEEWIPKEEFKTVAMSEKVAQFPIHSFLTKYFNHKNSFNLKEQVWYGSTD